MNHDSTIHPGIGISGTLVEGGAIDVSNFDVSRNLTALGGNGAIANLDVIELEELSLQLIRLILKERVAL